MADPTPLPTSEQYQQLLQQYQQPPGPSTIIVNVVGDRHWREFHPANEMTISKTGRLLHPMLQFNVRNLKETSVYAMTISMERVGDMSYKYTDDRWIESQVPDGENKMVVVRHPDLQSGKEWMKKDVSFPKLKLTTTDFTAKPNPKGDMKIALLPYFKYRPSLSIIEVVNGRERTHQFSFDMCQFIAVRDYHCPRIQKLKMVHIPKNMKRKWTSNDVRMENMEKRMKMEKEQSMTFKQFWKQKMSHRCPKTIQPRKSPCEVVEGTIEQQCEMVGGQYGMVNQQYSGMMSPQSQHNMVDQQQYYNQMMTQQSQQYPMINQQHGQYMNGQQYAYEMVGQQQQQQQYPGNNNYNNHSYFHSPTSSYNNMYQYPYNFHS